VDPSSHRASRLSPRFASRLAPSAGAFLVVLALVGCTTGRAFSRTGALQPTVAGRPPVAYGSLEEAKAAFSRSNGPMTALLEDAAWIRLEGDPAAAAERHSAYFEGLTTIQIQLATDFIARPTLETFVLEDSTGARVTGQPLSFKGDVGKGFGPRILTYCTITFDHSLTAQARWLRLTREGEGGGQVEWVFPE
jgi:hypothetical protein